MKTYPYDLNNPPDKPSELILMALEDLEAVERDPEYIVNMDTYHYRYPGVCAVCFAGSVMAKRLGANRLGADVEMDLFPSHFAGWVQHLRALNDLRCGLTFDAGMEWIPCKGVHPREVHSYDDDREAFKADMRKLAADYQAIGK